jgi:hypothetical protein
MKIIEYNVGTLPSGSTCRVFWFDNGYLLRDIVKVDGSETTMVYTKTRRLVKPDSKTFKMYDQIAFKWFNPTRSTW